MKSSYTLVAALPVILAWSVGCSAGADSGPLGGMGSDVNSTGGAFSAGGSVGGMAIGGSPATAGSSNSGGIVGSPGGAVGQAGSAVQQAGSAGIGGGAGAGTGGGAGAGTGGAGPIPTDGMGLYDMYCKQCHGEQGAGTQLAPEIQHPVRDYSTWVVRNGRAQTTFLKPMDKWGTDKLSDAQLTLIWDYLDKPPQPTTGKGLYDDYCANCHGANGQGGPTMRNIVNEVQNVLSRVRTGKNVGQYAMRHDSMPAFSTMRISDADLNLIHDYVDSF